MKLWCKKQQVQEQLLVVIADATPPTAIINNRTTPRGVIVCLNAAEQRDREHVVDWDAADEDGRRSEDQNEAVRTFAVCCPPQAETHSVQALKLKLTWFISQRTESHS